MAKSQGGGGSERLVFVAMSGGVDSSVAAFLLKEDGYDVAGVFMRCWNTQIVADPGADSNGRSGGCGWERDSEDARRVAEKLKIPFYVWDFEEDYKKRVVDYMIAGYRRGITPNPDVMCNREIKFGLFFERARAMGADYVATGHYVRRHEIKNQKSKIKNFYLSQAKDINKDQSYFLWTLTQGKLRHSLFPIGDYLKSEVREIARKAGLPTAEKKDSQGVCFLGKIAFADFLKQYIPEKRGDVLALGEFEGLKTYKKIGEHDGAQYYTIGQRHIGMANRGFHAFRQKGAWRTGRVLKGKENFKPVYVVEKDMRENTLVVAEGEDNPALYRKEAELTDVNFVNPSYSNILKNIRIRGMEVLTRVRYRQPLAEAELRQIQNPKIKNQKYILEFKNPVKFVAPGQSAVMYTAEGEVIGGGVIADKE